MDSADAERDLADLLAYHTYARQTQVDSAEEFWLVMAMNRLRHAHLRSEPGLEPFTHRL